MSFKVDGVALIVGAAGGIGEAAALSFVEAGAEAVVFADFDEAKAGDLADQSKQHASNPEYRSIALKVDVTDENSVQAMVERTLEEFGRIDYNVNSVGVANFELKPIAEASVTDFDRVNTINSRGVMLCVRAVSKAMSMQSPLITTSRTGERSLGRGSIVNVGSALSYIASSGYLPYTTSKHALIAITKTAALDNKVHGIRVNAVCPSWVDTPMVAAVSKRVPELTDMINKTSTAGRLATTDEVGDAIVFLCTPAASYINGAHLMVDSGVSLATYTG